MTQRAGGPGAQPGRDVPEPCNASGYRYDPALGARPACPAPAWWVETSVRGRAPLRGLSFSIGLWVLAAATPGDVKAQVAPASTADARAPLDVQAERVVFDPTARSAVFEGDVRATQGAISLRSPRLVARYGADQKLLSLEAQGGVQLGGEGVTATAERASWSATDETLVLEGAVTLTRGADVLQGTRLTYLPTSGRIELENARGRIRAPKLQLPGPVRP